MKVGNAMILTMTAWMVLVEEVSAAAAVASQVESTAGKSGKSIITVCADRSTSTSSSSSVMTGCLGWTKLPNRVWGGHHRAIVTLMVEEDEEEVPPTAEDEEAEKSDEVAAAGASITASEEDAELLAVTAASVQQYEDVPSSEDDDEDDDDENNTKATLNTDWEYKDGFLIASGYNDAATEDDRSPPPQCLGLDTYANYGRQYLTENSCKPYYPVTLHDCPPAASSKAAAADDMEEDALSRYLRFLMTENGQLQSLIPVLDSNAEDVMRTHPYCLTILAEVEQEAKDTETNSRRCQRTGAYLMPCVTTTKEDFAARTEGRDDADSAEVEDPSLLTVRSQFFGGVFQLNYHREQYFTVAGTSKPFLLALQRDWGFNDVVELVYHFGLESSSGSSLPPFSSLEAALSDSSSPLTQLSQTFAEQVAPEDDDNEDYSILIRTNSLPTAEEHDLVMIETPGKTSHGFIEFVPSDYRVSGPMTAALQGTTTIAMVSTTAFEVEPYQRHVNCPRHSSSSLSLMSSNTKIFVGVMCGIIVASIIIMLIVKTVCIDVDDTDNKDYAVDNNDDDDATTGKDTVDTDDHSTASSSPSSLDEESLSALDEKA